MAKKQKTNNTKKEKEIVNYPDPKGLVKVGGESLQFVSLEDGLFQTPLAKIFGKRRQKVIPEIQGIQYREEREKSFWKGRQGVSPQVKVDQRGEFWGKVGGVEHGDVIPGEI